MRRICVVARQAGSVLGVLGRELPLLPGAALHRALKQRDIRLNGLRVSSNGWGMSWWCSPAFQCRKYRLCMRMQTAWWSTNPPD